MIKKTIKEIASMVSGTLILNNASLDTVVHGVYIDSRKVEENGLYIPIIGERVDGHTFIKNIENKASLTLCSNTEYIPENIACIVVEDTVKALQELAKNYRQTLDATVIGITGSNGKTSCKDILAGCLSAKYKTQKTQGNHNNEIGVPLTLLELDGDCEMAVIEMGMENLEDIHFLNAMVDQDMSIITNVGIAHLENLGSIENIGWAKLEIVDSLHENDLFVYYGDDPVLSKNMETKVIPNGVKVETFGKNTNNTMYLTSLTQDENGIYFKTNASDFTFHIDILGEHQALNAMAALSCAYKLGMSEEEMQAGFDKMEKTKMRNELMQIQNAKILNDAYKSNPQSAIAALDTFELLKAPYKIAVLADMLDLGPTTNALHYDLGYALKNYTLDEVVCMGELGVHIAEGAKASTNIKVTHFNTREEVSAYLMPYLKKDCMLLFKGSRGMALDLVIDTLKNEGE